jgi:hypothetical protein
MPSHEKRVPSFISAPSKNSKTICTKTPSRSLPRAASANRTPSRSRLMFWSVAFGNASTPAKRESRSCPDGIQSISGCMARVFACASPGKIAPERVIHKGKRRRTQPVNQHFQTYPDIYCRPSHEACDRRRRLRCPRVLQRIDIDAERTLAERKFPALCDPAGIWPA